MTFRTFTAPLALVHLLGLALVAGCGDDAGGGTGGAGGSTSADGSGGSSGSGGDPGTGGGSGSGGSGAGSATSSNAAFNASSGDASAGTGDATTSSTGGGDAEPAGMEGMTAAHNAARASVDPPANPAIPPLTWDPTIAAGAQAYAEGCVWEHSGNGYGENIYASAGSNPGPQDVVDSWTSEESSYDYADNSCSGTCGHYTQVVWAASLNLGCGHAFCTTGSPFDGFPEWDFWVCNYDPAGNFNGQRPY